MVETYSHLGPRGRIDNIERDVEKERKEVIATFKARSLHAQSSVARLGWEFKELNLSCSNKERSIIKRQCEERLATAKVAWDAAKCQNKSTCRAVEKAHEAAVRLAEREQVGGEINSLLAKAKAEEKVARKRCKSALKAARKAYRTEVGSAKEEQKDALSVPRRDVCNNWDGSESRLDRILDNVVSSGHASMQRMESINKRMSRAQTLSLNRHGCSEDGIAEIEMMEEMQLCQGVLTDIRRMQLASSSGKSPPASRLKKDEKTIQRGKAIAEARQKLRILGRYKKDSVTTRARGKRTSKSKGWSSRSGGKGRGRRRKSYPSQGRTCSHGPCCDCCYCFCTRHLEGNDQGQTLAASSPKLALAQSYLANAATLTKVEQLMRADSSSLCFTFLAASLFCSSLSSLPTMLDDNEMKAIPTKTFTAPPSATSVTLESVCMGLVFFAALPLPSGKSFTLERDATAAVKAKIEGKEVDMNDSTKFVAMASKQAAQQKKRAMAAAAAAKSKLNQKWGGDGGTELDEVASQKRLLGGGDEDMDEPRFIFVKLPDSRLITLPFHPLKQISDVKREIECRFRFDPRDYSLYINGGCKRLDKDDLSLSDYGIGKDSTLVANVPMRAGLVGGDEEKEEECKHLCGDPPITSPLFHKFGIPHQDEEYDWWKPQAEEAYGPYPSSLFYDDEDKKQSGYGLCPDQACLHGDEGCSKEVAPAPQPPGPLAPVPVMPLLLGGAGGKRPLTPAAERMRKLRARRTDEEKEGAKVKDTGARIKARESMTAEEKDVVRDKDAVAKRKSKASMNAEEKGEARAVNATVKRRSRASMTAEEKDVVRDKDAVAKRKSKASMNAEEKGEARAVNARVKRQSRASRTPEEVETEKAKAKEGMRRLRGARKAVELAQCGDFARTKIWEVPFRDYKLKHFTEDPESSVLLFYANSGSWRFRASRMLVAWLHVCNKLICEMDDAKDTAGAKQAERKLRGLCTLSRERLEDRVSLLRVVREHFRGDDWCSFFEWRGREGINSFEMAELEWLVTTGLDSGDDCKLLREKRKQRPPLLDAWARSLIGMKLKVRGQWWDNWPSRYARTLYNCEIVDVDYEVGEAEVEEEDDKRYFVIHCEYDNRRYPMEYNEVREYCRGVEQKKKFDVPDGEPFKIFVDESFDKLCKDALEDLESGNCGGLDFLRSDVEKHRQSIIEEVGQIFDSQRVEPEKERELGEKFLKAQGRGTVSWGQAKVHDDAGLTSVDAPLLTCASCGFRRLHPSGDDTEGCIRVENRDVKLLDWAELNDAQLSEHLERMAKPALSIPINDKGGTNDFKPVETWKAYSRWPDKKPDELTDDTTLPDWMFCKNSDGETDRSNPKYFHLHPEFVEEFVGDDGRRDFKARLCPSCCKFKPNGKGKAPVRSVASGVDFGSPRRLGLVQLTARERQMISKVRHYSIAIKIESNTGRQRELSHSALRGHSILFDHDCPRVLEKLLREENINDSIDVHFVGPEGQYDHLARKALGSAHVSARPFAVYQWLKVLKEVNEMYSKDGELEEFPIVVQRIEKCNKALVEEAVMVTADKKTSRETDVGRDDIREVRMSSGRNQAPAASNVEEVSILFSLDIQCLADAKCLYPLQIGWVPPHSFLVNAFHLQCDLLLCLFRFG